MDLKEEMGCFFPVSKQTVFKKLKASDAKDFHYRT